MDASIISALAALTGAAIGGLTSIIGAWLTQQTQVTQEVATDKLRRQELYREFIEDASKTYGDALEHDKTDVSALIGIYTKINRMRFLSSPKVVESAEQLARAIIDTYLAPNVTLPELRDMMDKGRLDPFRFFAEACRGEILARFALLDPPRIPRRHVAVLMTSTPYAIRMTPCHAAPVARK
jgi:hypothetical protein